MFWREREIFLNKRRHKADDDQNVQVEKKEIDIESTRASVHRQHDGGIADFGAYIKSECWTRDQLAWLDRRHVILFLFGYLLMPSGRLYTLDEYGLVVEVAVVNIVVIVVVEEDRRK